MVKKSQARIGGTARAGLVYAFGAAATGWIAGRATHDTRQSAWIMHAAADLIIIPGYTLLA